MDGMVAALLAERDRYVLRDLPDRVALVDAELSARGYEQAAEARSAAAGGDDEARQEAPKRRGRPPKQTT